MINDLIRVLPPPAIAALIPSEDDFVLLEQQLGTSLPRDYREYWTTYGAGSIGEFLGILRPQQYASEGGYVGDSLEWLRRDQPDAPTRWRAHPAPTGLIPWGATDNGDVLCWRTIDTPDSWPVAVLPPRTDRLDDYGMSMTRFLARWIAGEIAVQSFPRDIVHGFVSRQA